MRRLLYVLPVIIFLALGWILLGSLRPAPLAAMKTALLGRPAPALSLPPLDAATVGIGPKDVADGRRVTLVNLFASWCIPCREEAPQLAQLARARGIRLIGVAYKDKPQAARAFLNEFGNPFERVGLDADGRAGIEWGISGVPETFVVDRHGIVRGRFGPLSPDGLVLDLLPAIARAASY
ncbi:MAG TPA: DsbE family thiol:disulfide interchange protein [Rhizomicrobium sp.]|nr:DsbE family thiol:disulfide interchange protein [Rhizomicrobium sp.]